MSLFINYDIKAITNGNQRLWQTAFDLSADLRSKISINPSYADSVHNHRCASQSFPVSPVHYTPKLGFSRHFSHQQVINGRVQ